MFPIKISYEMISKNENSRSDSLCHFFTLFALKAFQVFKRSMISPNLKKNFLNS